MSERAKAYSAQAAGGEAGVALIRLRVSQMGFVWHERGSMDAGIDGEIELRDVGDGTALNKVLFVQSKARSSPFPGEDEDGFYYPVTRRDVDYWLRADVPVLLVCSHPNSETAWWVNVTEWFSDADRLGDRLVRFDKWKDRFDASAAHRLLTCGAPKNRAQVQFTTSETLRSNLLTVVEMPSELYVAPTNIGSLKQAWVRMRSHGRRGTGWVLHDRAITSSKPLDRPPFDVLCAGKPDRIDAAEWAESNDEDVRRQFVRLLNMTIRDMHHRDLRWKYRMAYFKPGTDGVERYESSKSSRGRCVVKAIPSRTRKGEIAYVRHYGARLRFVQLGGRWYLSIGPDYHFTRDGYEDLPWASDARSGIKRIERNAAVRGQVEFWGRFLSRQENLFGDRADHPIRFGRLVRVETDHGFVDPAEDRDPETPQDTSLFDDEVAL